MKQKTQSEVTVNESRQDGIIYPLAIGLDCDEGRAQIIGANGWHVAYVEFSPAMETATRIVTAVNSYDELVEALKICYHFILGTKYAWENNNVLVGHTNSEVINKLKQILYMPSEKDLSPEQEDELEIEESQYNARNERKEDEDLGEPV